VAGIKVLTFKIELVAGRLLVGGAGAQTDALVVAGVRLHHRYRQVGQGLARFVCEGDLRGDL
jgi:hypothetical protein